jgi:hypothetical protein
MDEVKELKKMQMTRETNAGCNETVKMIEDLLLPPPLMHLLR